MKTLLKNSLLLLGMSLAGAALFSRWPEIKPRLVECNWTLLLLAVIGLMGYQFLNAGVWSLVLRSLGERVPFAQAARVWLQSEALRWLPGGIWGYGSRVLNAKELGVTKPKASASLVLELAVTNLAWVLTATILLFTPLLGSLLTVAQNASTQLSWNGFTWTQVSAGVAVTATLALSTYHFRARLIALVKRFVSLLPWRELQPKTLAQTLAAYLGLCVFNGLLLWLVVTAVPQLTLSPILVIGVGGAAWLAGFWAIGVPGGIGVREAALAFLFAVFGDFDSGLTVAILWRALQMLAELLSLLLVSLTALRTQTPSKTQPTPQSFTHFRFLNL